MSTTETLQPTSFESIPLQTLTEPATLPNDTEDDQPDIDTAQARQESREPQIEVESSAPAEEVTDHTETTSTKLSNVLDKWQLRLDATQVLVGVLAFAGFLAMIKFTVIDHYINNDSLKLSQWTAWMTFRDECRALLKETRNIGPDCQDVLYQPLSKPPIPMAESPSHDEKNITVAGRTARDNATTRERLSDLHVLSASIAEPTLLFGISVLLLAFGLGYVGYIATRRRSPRRNSRRIDTHHAWVPDHVARLHPDGSKGYATAQDTVSWSGALRKRVVMRKSTRIGEQYEESEIYRSFRKRLKTSTDTESLLGNWDETGQHGQKQENEESDHESAWLPTASSSENEERLSPLASEYLRTVELILAELSVLGCEYFAFDRVDEHASLDPFWRTATKEKCFCEFRRPSASSALVQEISTSDFIFPRRLFEDLKASAASDSDWLVEIPELNFDSVTVCTFDVDFQPKRGAPWRNKGTWKYWQSGKLGTVDYGFREAPCLRLMRAWRAGEVRLIFENVTIQDYGFILDRLGMEDYRPCHEGICDRFLPTAFMETLTEIMKKVMFAANEGSPHTHVLPQLQRDGSVIFAGRYIVNDDPLDQTGQSVKLLSIEQEDANDSTSIDTWSIDSEAPPCPPPSQIGVGGAEQTQDSLMPDTIEPASVASVLSLVPVDAINAVDSVDSGASPITSRRRFRQTVASWARVLFRPKARNEAEPSAAIPPDDLAQPRIFKAEKKTSKTPDKN